MKNLITLAILLLSVIGYTQELPQLKKDNQIIAKNGYIISYNETCEQANWVYYKLDSLDVIKNKAIKRKNNFKADKEVTTGSASLADYKGSGYDRGHLKASADESNNQEQMNETFYMSNMSPQAPKFNRGIWKSLESYVRGLALINDSVHVYTGGVLNTKLRTIGENKVCVPDFYYKIIVTYNGGNRSEILCWNIPNRKATNPLYSYQVKLPVLENFIGIDFRIK